MLPQQHTRNVIKRLRSAFLLPSERAACLLENRSNQDKRWWLFALPRHITPHPHPTHHDPTNLQTLSCIHPKADTSPSTTVPRKTPTIILLAHLTCHATVTEPGDTPSSGNDVPDHRTRRPPTPANHPVVTAVPPEQPMCSVGTTDPGHGKNRRTGPERPTPSPPKLPVPEDGASPPRSIGRSQQPAGSLQDQRGPRAVTPRPGPLPRPG